MCPDLYIQNIFRKISGPHQSWSRFGDIAHYSHFVRSGYRAGHGSPWADFDDSRPARSNVLRRSRGYEQWWWWQHETVRFFYFIIQKFVKLRRERHSLSWSPLDFTNFQSRILNFYKSLNQPEQVLFNYLMMVFSSIYQSWLVFDLL